MPYIHFGPQRQPGCLWGLFITIFKLCFMIAFMTWFGKALVLFFTNSYYPHLTVQDYLWPRLYVSARDSVHGLPSSLAWVADYIGSTIKGIYYEIFMATGDDPLGVATPSVPGDSPKPETSRAPAPWLTVPWPVLKESALFSFLTMTAVQFVGFCVIMARGVPFIWKYPGALLILSARPKLVLYLILYLVLGYITYSAFNESIGQGVVVLVVGLLCLSIPIASGLPLWVGHIFFGLKRKREPGRDGETRSGHHRAGGTNERARWHDRTEQRSERAGERAGAGPREEQSQRSHREPPPPPPAHETAYKEALETFDLKPGFDQKMLQGRYRDLMKKIHPDVAGSSGLTRRVNEHYEFLLNWHNWKR